MRSRWMVVSVGILLACSTPMQEPDSGPGDAHGADAPSIDANPDTGSCDADGDGHDSIACGGDDCDDADRHTFPGQMEVCDTAGHDEDCDPMTFGVRDGDGDGSPDAHCCNGTHCGDDCNDSRAGVHPDAPEVCNLIDDDCDAAIDEMVLQTFYLDADGDMFGVATMTTTGCTPPLGYASVAGDCNDACGGCNPGATEICDLADNDCDTTIDEAGESSTYYADADADGHGDPSVTMMTTDCTPPAGYVAVGDDCNDADPDAHPGATELCDRVDRNCSTGGGTAPDEDIDGDGHAAPTAACMGGLPRDDCDDTRAIVHPGATELCDRIDYDCSSGGGAANDEDADGDLHAPIGATCSSAGGAFPADDCDDHNPRAFGGAGAAADTSTCDGIDNDCDPRTSELGLACPGDGFCARGGRCAHPREAVDIATGYEQACAVRANGSVWCWGQDYQNVRHATPVAIPGISTAVELDVGVEHVCALLRDGTVSCWGGNLSGEVGDGTMTNRPAPTPAIGVTGAIALSSTLGYHTCALRFDGTVLCWGDGSSGGLGTGSTANLYTPGIVPVTGAAALALGDEQGCALDRDASISCWGDNRHGQLGLGTLGGQYFPPTTVAGLGAAVSVDTGLAYGCAALASGEVWCWGHDQGGQLGDRLMVDRASPFHVPGITLAVEVAAGAEASCARLSDGTVRCWGSNWAGELGNGTIDGTGMRYGPTQVAGLLDAVQIDLGEDFACARRTGGSVVCWGYNYPGTVGDGTTTDRPAPVDVIGFDRAVEVVAGYLYTCVRFDSGVVSCWGDGRFGELGDGLNTSRSSAGPVPGLTGIVRLWGGIGDNTCAQRADGSVSCWGNGIGSTPVAMPALNGSTQIEIGGQHSCALAADGSVRCFGSNGNGQLGDGTTTDRSTPTPVLGLTDVIDVSLGSNHTCALHRDGTVSCWGRNAEGQLGDGTTTQHTSPTVVPGIIGAIAVASASVSSCAVLGDGTARCWGENGFGELGDGTTTDSLTPRPVSSLTGARDITCGGEFCCAELGDGTARCWGFGYDGELGDAAMTGAGTTARAVIGVAGIRNLALGYSHGCAATAGAVRCWGDNSFGQIGNGSMTDVLTPIIVPGL